MIDRLSHTTVWVLDQDSAKDFYTRVLGFELRNDIPIGGDVRWLTVGPPGRPEQELILANPGMGHDPATADAIRELVAKGALGPGVMATEDCRGTHAELVAKGVEFLQEPAEQPYGIEAVFRDDSGNWFSLTQRH
jgi:catechol 2,3-dioxygenase-like lactoylglutathione lyase family enzyme